MKQQSSPRWPVAVPTARGRITTGMNNLSQLPKADRARIFGQLKTQQPEIADLVTRMHRQFGSVELLIDQATAAELEAQP